MWFGYAKKDRHRERTERFILSSEVDEMLNHSVGPEDYQRDPVWSANVVRHFELNLNRMIDIASRCGARLVLISPISNLRDCSPFKSEFASELAEDKQDELQRHLLLAQASFDDGDFEQALDHLDRLLEVDGGRADAHLLRGKSLFELRRFPEAKASLQEAIDQDVCPLRATSSIKKVIRKKAQTKDVITSILNHG